MLALDHGSGQEVTQLHIYLSHLDSCGATSANKGPVLLNLMAPGLYAKHLPELGVLQIKGASVLA